MVSLVNALSMHFLKKFNTAIDGVETRPHKALLIRRCIALADKTIHNYQLKI